MHLLTTVYYLIVITIINTNNKAFDLTLCVEVAYQALTYITSIKQYYAGTGLIISVGLLGMWRFSNFLKSIVIVWEVELDLYKAKNQSFTHWWVTTSRYY